ncbi:Zn-dependent protease [Levilactobacillus senmaizukei DSM 21775 = NBRC 103853]|uniref:Zn-dependent protease n=1 Tax=Levilactobacillus senmaizukei DSM 21775 = NBRC 103853 TaxID=1423803 RepID=A0A0R2DMT8_9LACO|nr:matrixin family metalloprotease [Levilactobacillus senmaizukei]KRN01012.1 Zn-dependent protease [Levilactobacillus senmaizukei DSM 21775 = NBRC 103853]
MRKLGWSLLLGGLLLGGLFGHGTRVIESSQQRLEQLQQALPIVGRQERQRATPIESIVTPNTLRSTYHYHFAKGVPGHVQALFMRAIAEYNETGVVNLVAGQPLWGQNGITLFAYHKATSDAGSQYLELGKGGPEIHEVSGLDVFTVNRARSGLNVDHPTRLRASIAVHEVGHALGLDHSEQRSSVMFPVDQGTVTLSTADLQALRHIYPAPHAKKTPTNR